jgi:RNA polymerase sigma factor (sigma-70 family)
MSQQPWNALQVSFLELINPGPADWRAVWGLMVEDAWYQDQLAACAYKMSKRCIARGESADDLRQEAMTLLGRQLRRSPDLHADPRRIDVHFEPWVRSIIFRHCLEALRRLLRTRRQVMSLPEGIDLIDPRTLTRSEWADISLIVEDMPKPMRTVFQLWLGGLKCKEIAQQLGKEHSGICRECRAAIRILRHLMRDE